MTSLLSPIRRLFALLLSASALPSILVKVRAGRTLFTWRRSRCYQQLLIDGGLGYGNARVWLRRRGCATPGMARQTAEVASILLARSCTCPDAAELDTLGDLGLFFTAAQPRSRLGSPATRASTKQSLPRTSVR